MSDQEKTTLFNPKDKLNERQKPKIYIDYIPQKLKAVAKKNKCFYDIECHKWYTNDPKNMIIQDFGRKNINFWEFMNDIGVQYDKETKQWYTYNSNEVLKNFFND